MIKISLDPCLPSLIIRETGIWQGAIKGTAQRCTLKNVDITFHLQVAFHIFCEKFIYYLNLDKINW